MEINNKKGYIVLHKNSEPLKSVLLDAIEYIKPQKGTVLTYPSKEEKEGFQIYKSLKDAVIARATMFISSDYYLICVSFPEESYFNEEPNTYDYVKEVTVVGACGVY